MWSIIARCQHHPDPAIALQGPMLWEYSVARLKMAQNEKEPTSMISVPQLSTRKLPMTAGPMTKPQICFAPRACAILDCRRCGCGPDR